MSPSSTVIDALEVELPNLLIGRSCRMSSWSRLDFHVEGVKCSLPNRGTYSKVHS